MLEHAIYSVISPEGCASILWRSNDNAKDAAEQLRLTAQDIHKLGIIDAVVPEPMGGAHRNIDQMFHTLSQALESALRDLSDVEGGVLRARRREKFLEMGRAGLS